MQIKEKWSCTFAIDVKQLLNGQGTTVQLFQKQYWENFKITDHKYEFRILKIIAFVVDIKFIGQATKEPLNNFEPQKS